jgi:hypothetical protein
MQEEGKTIVVERFVNPLNNILGALKVLQNQGE